MHTPLEHQNSNADPSRKSVWRWAYPVGLAAMVVLASGRGQVAAPAIINIDKFAHFTIFGLIATLVARAPGAGSAWRVIAMVSIFGIADEFRQSFTPGRFVEFADWVADTAGAIVAVALYRGWPFYRRLLETPLRLPRASTHAPSRKTALGTS